MICPINDCGRKIGLIDQTTCKCNKCSQFYCKIHRLAEDHKCSYNFKEKNEEKKFNICMPLKKIFFLKIFFKLLLGNFFFEATYLIHDHLI